MSSINPNNIDGTYPVAGQDNDSQGFRDNFTNIKNNLSFAKTEIEDLQNNAILKTALSGGTLNNDMNYAQLKSAQLLKTVYTKNSLSSVSGSQIIDWSTGHFQNFSTAGSVNLSFSSWPTSGLYTTLRLEANVTNAGHSIAFAAGTTDFQNLSNVQGASGNVITFSSPGVYLFEFSTYNNGTSVYVRDLSRNYDITTTGASAAFVDGSFSGTLIGGSITSPTIGNAGAVITGTTGAFSGILTAGALQGVQIGNVGSTHTGTDFSGAGTATFGNVQAVRVGNASTQLAGNLQSPQASVLATTLNVTGITTSGNVQAVVVGNVSANVFAGNATVSNYGNIGNVQAVQLGNVGTTHTGTTYFGVGTATFGNVQAVVFGNVTANVVAGNVTAANVRTTSNIGWSGISTVAVTQTTGRTTAVTSNTPFGNIVLVSASLGAYASTQFQLFSTNITAGDYVMVQQGAVGNTYVYTTSAFANAAGQAIITLKNNGPVASPSESVNLLYAVLKTT